MPNEELDHSLFDSSNESSGNINVLNLENDYAKKYNDWRRKEELQKLKDKYGDNLDIMSEIEESNDDTTDNDDAVSSDSDEESDSNESIDQDPFDEDFFKIYSALKCKDPKIYNKSFQFFNQNGNDEINKIKSNKAKRNESNKLTLPEYHRKLIEEKKGITEEDEIMMKGGDEEIEYKNNGYYEELYNIRNEIKGIVGQKNEDVDSEDLFSIKTDKKSKSLYEQTQSNKQNEKNKFISTFWNKNKELDSNEEFLKDFVINKRYDSNKSLKEDIKKYTNVDGHFGGFNNLLDVPDMEGFMPDNDSNKKIIKNNIEVAKYHFEEPDANLIKRYPRTNNSIRDTFKEKKTKRAEIRERKKTEKETELKRLRKLKREETESKLEKLKEISGNESINIKDLDLNVIIDDENDFEPEKYDQKMKLLFGENYYNTNDDQSKPKFEHISEIDDDLGDAQDPLEGTSLSNKKQKKNKKEIKLKKDIMADDDIGIYEDLIGGEVATRFLYRMVEPNDFGLTDEEIILADDKELNQWCSLKKMSQYRSKETEIYDKNVYSQKANNLELKKKILKSVYGNNNDDYNKGSEDADNEITEDKPNKRSKKRRAKKNKTKYTDSSNNLEILPSLEKIETTDGLTCINASKSKKRKRSQKSNNSNQQHNSSDVDLLRLKAYGMSNKEIKRLKNKL